MAAQEEPGTIRGVVYDRDFEAPLAGVEVSIVGRKERVETSDRGDFVLRQIPPGTYTLVFFREGYLRQVKPAVVVTPGRLTEVEARLAGDFAEMDEFVVEDTLQVKAGTEMSLLELRFDSPALLDSISSELLSRAGASDAAGALRLVAGASVQDGKFAVVRGLPDRYVSSQLNGVRLPSADEDTRAVELDQFPSAVIESIQVTKTFTPDQQGDASGGAVNVVLKSIPERPFYFQVKSQLDHNSNVRGRDDFLSYDGGGVDFWGKESHRDVQLDDLGDSWNGAVGTSERSAPPQYKWSIASGGSHAFSDDFKIGGFANFFYERDAAYFDDGVDDSYWITEPGGELVPRTIQGVPQPDADPPGAFGDFKTQLFDVTQGTESVQWGNLLTGGIDFFDQSLRVTSLYTRTTEDKATLAVDTRGKAYFFPGYDPFDPFAVGNEEDNRDAAPYLVTETLEYTEREIRSLIVRGDHKVPTGRMELTDFFAFRDPELDWTIADSSADLDQPDKRQFGAQWKAPYFKPGRPPFTDDQFLPGGWEGFKPSANFTLGNVQRIFKEIDEESDQYFVNLELPFEQWSEDLGSLKFGIFSDEVRRTFDQDTFSNFDDNSRFEGGFDDRWSDRFPFEDHPITEALVDVDYRGEQEISAWYGMMDLPLFSRLRLIGGARVESTEISIVNVPEEDATWFPPGDTTPRELTPGAADVDFDDDETLPSIGLIYSPIDELTLRGSYSETVARQTFKELTPILQQEFLGGPIFIGNPDLQMAKIKNYDLRADYRPYEGGLISVSYFLKDLDDPIEYVQRVVSFDFTTPVNYPSGKLEGWEVEMRQELDRFWKPLSGLAVGGNATFIDSEVRLPLEERLQFQLPNIASPRDSRNATAAPEHLYNLYLTYDSEITDTQLGLFYTVTGDTLISGAGVSDGNLVPDVYANAYETLNLTVTQGIGKYLKLRFQAKNLTDPRIRTEYRPRFGQDRLKSSFTRGIDYSIGFVVEVSF